MYLVGVYLSFVVGACINVCFGVCYDYCLLLRVTMLGWLLWCLFCFVLLLVVISFRLLCLLL